jgi:hypothetical protein
MDMAAFLSSAAANEDWYYVILAVAIRQRASLGGKICHGLSKEPARRTTPMSKANANPTAEALTWHAMGVEEVERG